MWISAFFFFFCLKEINPASCLRFLVIPGPLTSSGCSCWPRLICRGWSVLVPCCLRTGAYLVTHLSTPIAPHINRFTCSIMVFPTLDKEGSVLLIHGSLPLPLRVIRPVLLVTPAPKSSSKRFHLSFPLTQNATLVFRFI